MTRPFWINTDIADLPSRSLFLLTARGHLDDGGLPALAVDVDACGLQLRDRLASVRVVRRTGRRLLDHAVRLGDRRRLGDGGGRHEADAALVRPDELVDLVQLP